jgi:hypothetical protein
MEETEVRFFQAFIDFEASQAERERTRHLYERLLERTGHVKVRVLGTRHARKRLTFFVLGLHLIRPYGGIYAWWGRGRRGGRSWKPRKGQGCV